MAHRARRGQALLLAALVVAATIYSIYALTLTYTQTSSQPTQAEIYTEALAQALAGASKTQNTSLASQLYYQYISEAEALSQHYNMATYIPGRPSFQYYGYDEKLCVGCNVTATASLGPYSVVANLTLISQTQAEHVLRLSYKVNGQEIPPYRPQASTSMPAQISWDGDTLTVLAETQSTFTLTVTTEWGLILQCLL